ncbi:MAG: hypothetical protein COW73_00465 [Nitrospirae bacterium CG18_big_fil_WC_8_21_14_2_50_70_55]|nr:hypothetical protein [Deltaproteobacteria bacterium]OIP63632.1 MAG: hypothetical protein AUK30_08120 [Nitrospirae bacterium CG2_30_70_394]PIQ07198.1 MAG: hypothetical protein COW73_00465 [Nitrospirae bacterium CG18_big_fil_WC_8_21_14_2_50_70_55]PIU77289.1 MAG: hypothetical protein COS73_11345 [Nitrospirae bacterium CG06_land_8_20_14_3_00_70_43]PIW83657.1 MAG: hypothetical protein COZ96_02215 [Nitrospirae bacterium CG_4_8_14_3_um_filter_70_85]PIX83677.1 MAG: hypothetical protein COZ33_04185 
MDATDARDRLDTLAAGFMEAKVLLTGAELHLFDHLTGAGATAAGVAQTIGATVRGVEILLDALVALEVIDKLGDRYRNRPAYAPLLVGDGDGQFAALLRHRAHCFRGWAHLEEKIRGEADRDDDRSVIRDPATNRSFIRAMAAVSGAHAAALVDHLDLDGVHTVGDLGGGPGSYLLAMVARQPEIEPYLIDLPLTLVTTRALLAEAAAGQAIHTVAWDFYHDPEVPTALPPFDLLFLSQVVHAESSARNADLFARLAPLLTPGGRLVVHETTLEPDHTRPREATLFAVNMVAMTDSGRVYTAGEIAAWGEAAGLVCARWDHLGPRSCLITLRRPKATR